MKLQVDLICSYDLLMQAGTASDPTSESEDFLVHRPLSVRRIVVQPLSETILSPFSAAAWEAPAEGHNQACPGAVEVGQMDRS